MKTAPSSFSECRRQFLAAFTAAVGPALGRSHSCLLWPSTLPRVNLWHSLHVFRYAAGPRGLDVARVTVNGLNIPDPSRRLLRSWHERGSQLQRQHAGARCGLELTVRCDELPLLAPAVLAWSRAADAGFPDGAAVSLPVLLEGRTARRTWPALHYAWSVKAETLYRSMTTPRRRAV